MEFYSVVCEVVTSYNSLVENSWNKFKNVNQFQYNGSDDDDFGGGGGGGIGDDADENSMIMVIFKGKSIIRISLSTVNRHTCNLETRTVL